MATLLKILLLHAYKISLKILVTEMTIFLIVTVMTDTFKEIDVQKLAVVDILPYIILSENVNK